MQSYQSTQSSDIQLEYLDFVILTKRDGFNDSIDCFFELCLCTQDLKFD